MNRRCGEIRKRAACTRRPPNLPQTRPAWSGHIAKVSIPRFRPVAVIQERLRFPRNEPRRAPIIEEHIRIVDAVVIRIVVVDDARPRLEPHEVARIVIHTALRAGPHEPGIAVNLHRLRGDFTTPRPMVVKLGAVADVVPEDDSAPAGCRVIDPERRPVQPMGDERVVFDDDKLIGPEIGIALHREVPR